MIIRILGVLVGLSFVAASGLMMFIGQDGLFSQICILIVGLVFTAYGLMGPQKMGKFLPAAVKEIGGETIPGKSSDTEA